MGFASIGLDPGERGEATVALDGRAWTHWSPAVGDWVVDTEPVELLVGRSSRDISATLPLDPSTCPPRLAEGG